MRVVLDDEAIDPLTGLAVPALTEREHAAVATRHPDPPAPIQPQTCDLDERGRNVAGTASRGGLQGSSPVVRARHVRGANQGEKRGSGIDCTRQDHGIGRGRAYDRVKLARARHARTQHHLQRLKGGCRRRGRARRCRRNPRIVRDGDAERTRSAKPAKAARAAGCPSVRRAKAAAPKAACTPARPTHAALRRRANRAPGAVTGTGPGCVTGAGRGTCTRVAASRWALGIAAAGQQHDQQQPAGAAIRCGSIVHKPTAHGSSPSLTSNTAG